MRPAWYSLDIEKLKVDMSLWGPEFFPEVEVLDKSSYPRDRYFPQLYTREVVDVRVLHAPSSWLTENRNVLGYYQVAP